jgi:cobalt-zinc-cadmium efflux system outer membrane protein
VNVGRLAVVVAILAASLPAGQIARAQDSGLPELLTLPELLRLVAVRSPRLAVERVGIDAAQAELTTAGALPNPTISYGRSRPSGGAPNSVIDGTRQQQAGIDLPVLIAGQRGARVEAAEQGVLGARARVELAGSELALRAAELFAGLQAAQEKIVVLGEAQVEIERAAALISGRLESGMASRYDLARVEIEVAGIAVRLAEARADAAEKSAGIAALLGAPGWRPRAAGVLLPSDLLRGVSAGLPALSGNPQIVAARRDEETARAAVKRAERERWPVPTLSLSRTWTSEPFGAANFLGFSTEVPLFDTRRGQLEKAQAELRAAERRREAVEAEAAAELQRLQEALAQRRAALERFERRVDVRNPALRQMAEDAYRLGRSTVLELIDAARTRVDARITEIDLRAFAVQQELRILALTGGLRG